MTSVFSILISGKNLHSPASKRHLNSSISIKSQERHFGMENIPCNKIPYPVGKSLDGTVLLA